MAIKQAVVVLSCAGGMGYTQFRRFTDLTRYVDNTLVTSRADIREITQRLSKSRPLYTETAGFLASYSHPPAKVNKHLAVLHELFDKADQLESIHAMLVSRFSDMARAQPLINRTAALLAYTKGKVEKALAQLSTAVEKHRPEFYGACCDALYQRASLLKGARFLKPIHMLRVMVDPSTDKVTGTQFSTYLCFKNLKDDSGYVHARYHIVISCLVDKFGRYAMNYALQPNLLLPGRFKAHNTFNTPAEGWQMILNSLREEGFSFACTSGDQP